MPIKNTKRHLIYKYIKRLLEFKVF